MAAQNQEQKFFEIIKPGSNYEFIGRQKYWIGLSIVLTALTVVMLPLNAYVFKSRGHMLNWGVDFRGGSEILIEFSQAGRGRRDPQDAGRRSASTTPTWSSTTTRPARSSGTTWCASAPSRSSPSSRPSRSASRWPRKARRRCKRFEWSEGGDKIYLRYDKPVEPSVLANSLKAIGVNTDAGAAVRPRRRQHLRGDAGRPRHRDPPRARRQAGRGRGGRDPPGRVGRRQGRQAAAVRRRRGRCSTRSCSSWCTSPSASTSATARARSSRCSTTRSSSIGAFAVTYKEFSLTTVAAVLTIIGFSMNDTIVVFDRIRENAARLRDRRFDRVVNQSINETLSRTI